MHSFLEPRKLGIHEFIICIQQHMLHSLLTNTFVVHRFPEGSFMLVLEVQASFDKARNSKEFTILI